MNEVAIDKQTNKIIVKINESFFRKSKLIEHLATLKKQKRLLHGALKPILMT